MFVDAGAAHGILLATNGHFFGSSGFFTAIKRKKKMQLTFSRFSHFCEVTVPSKTRFYGVMLS